MGETFATIKIAVLGLVLAALSVSTAEAARYGYVEFPRDEHEHVDGWNFWWGAAELATESGNRYTVGIAFDSLNGLGLTGNEIYPHQGPYAGRIVASMEGPEEWGHGPAQFHRFASKMSNHLPGVSELLQIQTFDAQAGGKRINLYERTSLSRESYHLRLDHDEAYIHPTGERVRFLLDLNADMRSPPLLAGGTGQWWYGLPEAHHYPSRSYQYMQGAQRLTGTLELEQPDGSILREKVVPERSRMLMIREYDAEPEDLGAGLALAESTQLHPRYASYYEGGMPWELIFMDLDNGAQLMLGVMAFHDTPDGTLTPFTGPDQPTYKLLATLRLPSGESVALDDKARIEHLSYKTSVGRVPTFWVAVKGIWTQSWEYRVSHPGGKIGGVTVPPFDLGVQPQFDKTWPPVDDRGNGPTQRIPFDVAGSWAGCPMRGFGWSELIINWRGREGRDPWWTGGELPRVPKKCGKPGAPASGTPGDLDPPPAKQGDPEVQPEGCSAFAPGTPTCEYVAASPGGVGGNSSTPGGWQVKINDRVIKSFGNGHEMYACGTIKPGDKVVATAQEGSGVFAGNPGICF